MKRGYTIIVLVLILMVVSLFIITSTNFLGVDEAKLSVIRRDSNLGFYLSTSCAEEALKLIRDDPRPEEFTREETRLTITFPGGYQHGGYQHACWYSVQGRMPKYIYTRSEIPNFPRPLEIKILGIERPPSRRIIIIEYWLEK